MSESTDDTVPTEGTRLEPYADSKQPSVDDLDQSGRRPTSNLPARLLSLLLMSAAYGVSFTILLVVVLSLASNRNIPFSSVTRISIDVTREGAYFQSSSTGTSPAILLTMEIIELDAGAHAARLQIGARVRPDGLTSEQLRA